MSDYMCYPEDRISFTKNSPRCPKCGGKTQRTYQIGGGVFSPYRDSDWSGVEFLNVYCQDCTYRFPQYVKTPKKKQSNEGDKK